MTLNDISSPLYDADLLYNEFLFWNFSSCQMRDAESKEWITTKEFNEWHGQRNGQVRVKDKERTSKHKMDKCIQVRVFEHRWERDWPQYIACYPLTTHTTSDATVESQWAMNHHAADLDKLQLRHGSQNNLWVSGSNCGSEFWLMMQFTSCHFYPFIIIPCGKCWLPVWSKQSFQQQI